MFFSQKLFLMKKLIKFFKEKVGTDLSLPLLEQDQLSIKCKSQNLTQFPFRIPHDHPIESIDISDNEIHEIPSSLVSLKFLDYSNNNLKEISPNVEKAILSFKSLIELRISSNSIENIPQSFQTLTTLRTFISNNNKIKEYNVSFTNIDTLDLSCNLLVDFRFFTKTLSSLNLSFNRLPKVDFISESNVSNLKELFLSGNDLTSFPDKIKLNSLKILNISFNKIKNKLPDFSKITPNLEVLDISYNKIDVFPESLPITIKVVKAVHNKITEIPSLMKYTSLESLLLENNQIKKISDLPPSITDISLDSNCIDETEINEISLPNISLLFMNENSLKNIPPFKNSEKVAFFSMTHNFLSDSFNIENLSKSIARLDLSSNKIKCVPPELFTSLPELKQLFIFGNEIQELPNEFSSSSLKILNISSNPLTSLPPVPPTLVVLSAQGCHFSEFPISPLSMAKAESLTCIDFSNNSIESIPQFMEKEGEGKDDTLFLDRIEAFLFSCNKLTEFPQFSNSIRHIDLSQNLIQDVSIVESHDILTSLDISHNNLRSLNVSVTLLSLTTFKLSHNNFLSHKFSYANFPKLDCLDISHTSVVIDNGQPKKRMRELIRSNSYSLTPMMKIFTDDESVGYAEMKGNRRTMEDSLIIRHMSLFDVYGVVDGHAGDRTSTLTAFKLPELIERFDRNSIIRAIKNLNDFLFQKSVTDGATIAFVVLKKDQRIISLNIGDTRTLIVQKDGTVIPLSIDHKPSNREELEEIRRSGSFVSSDNRTAGILSISRAIGDFKIRGISAIPSVNERIITEDDYRVVIACDGVFDVLSNEEVGRIVLNEESPIIAAYNIRNTAYSHLSDDNISVIVADLHSANDSDGRIDIETASSSSLLLRPYSQD